MAKFQIYTYMFRPVMENQYELPFEEFDAVDVKDSLAHKQDILGAFLDNCDALKFKYEGAEFAHMNYIHQQGVYVFRIANNNHRPAKVETNFKVSEHSHHPSCIAIVDNRKDRQVIAIENKSAFSKELSLSAIIQETFRKAIAGKRLTLDVTPKFHTSEFWQVVNEFDRFKGIESVDFPFPYPNLPEVSDMVGEYFTNVARRTNSEPTLHLFGQNKESLNLEHSDKWLLSAIKACAASGRPILIKPRGFELRKIGVDSPVYEEIDDRVLKELGDLDFFDSNFQSIAEFLNKIKLVYE